MSEFLLKPRICFGQDALSVLNELSARSVLLVTDKAMVKFGLAERVTALLRQRGIAWQMWDDVVADPDIATVVRGMKLMDNHYPDLVIALGGGSVIDAAKAVIFSLAQTRPQPNRPRPCFVAIPTTSGTEATSDGSRMAISGSSDASTSTSFSALAFTTEKAVTSEPVPLVVGMATKHGRGRLGCGRVCAREKITALAASITEPPPSAITRSG